MRQGQQNRRGRGRHNNGGHGNFNNNNNNNRKGQNPLARSYESNGPDVKIRGNPAHIAEKYMTLARDAQSSGDSVLAESYLQHAEHYNRIIMAYREQQQSGEGQFRPRPHQGDPVDGNVEAMDEDGEDGGGDVTIRGQEPQPPMFDSPQPRYGDQQGRDERGPREDRPQRNFDDRQQRRHDGNRDRDRDRDRDGGRRDRFGDGQRERGFGGSRDDRPERRERYDRFQGQDRGQERSQDRGQGERGYQDRGQDRQPQFERAAPAEPQRVAAEVPVAAAAEVEIAPVVTREPRETPRRRAPAADRFVEGAPDQPEFLRRPVRRPRREAPVAEAGEPQAKEPGTDE